MNQATVIDIARETVNIILKVSAPMLLASLVVGPIVSLLQTITSIQEATLTFVPKLLVILLMLVLTGGWMMQTIVEFTVTLFNNFGNYVHEAEGFIMLIPGTLMP